MLSDAVSMLGSIPFFIASSKNKRRANAVSAFVQIEKMPVFQGTGNQSFPAMGVRLSL